MNSNSVYLCVLCVSVLKILPQRRKGFTQRA